MHWGSSFDCRLYIFDCILRWDRPFGYAQGRLFGDGVLVDSSASLGMTLGKPARRRRYGGRAAARAAPTIVGWVGVRVDRRVWAVGGEGWCDATLAFAQQKK